MAVAWINGANNTAASGTSVVATYTPFTTGNFIVVFVAVGGAVTALSVVDNLGNPLIPGPTYTGAQACPAGTGFLYAFVGFAAAAATSYTASWTGAQVSSIVLSEYRGVGTYYWVNQSWFNTGTSATASITETTTNANSWMVAGMMNNSSDAFSGIAGSFIRESTSGVTACLALVDSGAIAVNTSTQVKATQAASVAFGAFMLQLSPFAGGGYSSTNPTGATANPKSFDAIIFDGFETMKSPNLGSGSSVNDDGVAYGNYYPPYGQIWPRYQ